MYSVGLYTLGCKVSQYETEAVAEALESKGFRILPFDEVADAYVINTCTVTAESDRKSRQMIRRAISLNPDAVVAVIGCYSQRSPEEVSSIKGVDIVIGTDFKLSVVDRIIEALEGRREKRISVTDLSEALFEPMAVKRAPRTRAYVKIEDGCECKCTYCAIADARGRVRSKPPLDVVKEIETLYSSGTREIVLTGIETGSYGKDFDYKLDLGDLIMLLDERHSCDRLRLGSLAPELVSESFAQKIAGAKILAPHFHLSVQSGSDRILRAMKRRYNRETALRNIEMLRRLIPGVEFTTDLIVGFPGETEEDYLLTEDFLRRVGFIDAHVFTYSRRKGTPAAAYPDQVSPEVKKDRSKRLISLKNRVREDVLSRIVALGEPLNCVAETYDGKGYTSHSDSFAEVVFEAEDGLQGKWVKVAPVSSKNGIIYGMLVK